MLLSDWLRGKCTWVFSWSGWVCILIKFLIDLKEKLLDTGTNSAVINLKFLWLWLENNQAFILQQRPPRCRMYNFTTMDICEIHMSRRNPPTRCASSQYWQQITIWYLVHPLKHSQWWSYSEYLSKEFLFHEESAQIDHLHDNFWVFFFLKRMFWQWMKF